MKKVLIFLFLISTILPKHVLAGFYDDIYTQKISFFIPEKINPNSLLQIDQNLSNNSSFIIHSVASDNSQVKQINLYYSHNFGPWLIYPQNITAEEGNFNFNSPSGDGLYSFESLATDIYGNQEIREFDYFHYQVKVDTKPPTTNLHILPDSLFYSGQNYLDDRWQFSEHSFSDFQIGETNFSIGSTAYISQEVSLPSYTTSTFSFSYHFISHDIVDFDHFDVFITDTEGKIIKNILSMGNFDTTNFDFDSGWQTISQNLTFLAGRTFKIFFQLTDTGLGDDLNSYVFIKNPVLSTLDTRFSPDSQLDITSTDLNSEIISQSTLPEIIIGENIISLIATDSANNSENGHYQNIIVAPYLNLNKITSQSISVFNNSLSSEINLTDYQYSIDDSPLAPIATSSAIPLSEFTIFFDQALPQKATVNLYKNNQLVESLNYDQLNLCNWYRQGNPLGPWIKQCPSPEFNLEFRPLVSKITLSVSGLAQTLPDMTYTISYMDISGPQEIFGQIFTGQIDQNGNSSREFFIGTCSSGGTCIPDSGLVPTFKVKFSNLPEKIFNF